MNNAKPKNAANPFRNPSKKQVVGVVIVWLTGSFLSLAAMTDLFTRSAFQSRNLMMLFLLLASTVVVAQTLRNYRAAQKKTAAV